MLKINTWEKQPVNYPLSLHILYMGATKLVIVADCVTVVILTYCIWFQMWMKNSFLEVIPCLQDPTWITFMISHKSWSKQMKKSFVSLSIDLTTCDVCASRVHNSMYLHRAAPSTKSPVSRHQNVTSHLHALQIAAERKVFKSAAENDHLSGSINLTIRTTPHVRL